jgi:hypothetical protein
MVSKLFRPIMVPMGYVEMYVFHILRLKITNRLSGVRIFHVVSLKCQY